MQPSSEAATVAEPVVPTLAAPATISGPHPITGRALTARLFQADCRDVLRSLEDNSIDSVVTDPPYALVSIVKRFGKPGSAPAVGNDAYQRASAGFMGKQWDTGETAFSEEFWAEVLRVLKPGGHVVAFSGTRTYHRMAVAIEDAGFEIRDQLGWLYGSGFPKSHDVSKGIDKVRDWTKVKTLNDEIRRARTESGLNLKKIGEAMMSATDGQYGSWYHRGGHMFFETGRSLPSRPEWDRLRRVLPISAEFHEVYEAAEREVTCQQAGSRLAVAPGQGEDRSAVSLDITAPATPDAIKWQGWGTALKPAWEPICLARKPLSESTVAANVLRWGTGALNIDGCRVGSEARVNPSASSNDIYGQFEGAEKDGRAAIGRWPANICHDGSDEVLAGFPADGDECAARFFYCAKASRADRDEGLAEFQGATTSDGPAVAADNAYQHGITVRKNSHPTVKPTALMQWLCRMVTPPGGTVLDPFMGSGSTGKAALREGFDFVGCEREDEYMPIAKARVASGLRLAPVSAPKPANDNRTADLFSVPQAASEAA